VDRRIEGRTKVTAFASIAGYAVPFNQVEPRGDLFEVFDPHAFDAMLNRGNNVFLNFGDHDAPPIARPLTLFVDHYGLGWITAVSTKVWAGICWAVTRGAVQFCSIGTTSEEVARERVDGRTVNRVVRAHVEHITLTAMPVYRGTGVWPCAVLGDCPPRIDALQARWQRGFDAWRRRQQQGGGR
jgi:phage head maturation protease